MLAQSPHEPQAGRRAGQTHLIPGFAGLLFAVMIRQNQPFVCRLRHLALFAAHVLEYSSALDARKARPARPTGTALWAAFRSVSAQKVSFSLPARKNLASAVAPQEL